MGIFRIMYSILLLFIWQSINGQPDSLIVPIKDSLLNKYGYVNKKDSSVYIIVPRFDYATSFHNSYARASIDSLEGLVDKKGKFIFKRRTKGITTLHNNILIATDTICTILNFYGEPIVHVDYSSLYWNQEELIELPFLWEREIVNKLDSSLVKDGELIARVLSMYTDPEVRIREMINLSMAYNEFAVLILNYLHGKLEEFYGKEKLEYIKGKKFKRK